MCFLFDNFFNKMVFRQKYEFLTDKFQKMFQKFMILDYIPIWKCSGIFLVNMEFSGVLPT